MNSLGMIPVPQMAASSHDNYGASGTGPASVPLVIDESSTAAADNTMQQILNQSQLTGSACDTSTVEGYFVQTFFFNHQTQTQIE